MPQEKRFVQEDLDSVLAGKKCTYIKYDVEGADLEAIKGSEYTISRYAPKICKCVVSQTYDYITLPLYINSLCKGYKFYIRQEDTTPHGKQTFSAFMINKEKSNEYNSKP